MTLLAILISFFIAYCEAGWNKEENYSFEPFHTPQQSLCVKNNVNPDDASMDETEFKIVQGLNGMINTVSFQSKKNSNIYIRHQNNDVKTYQFEDSALFRNESSFFIRERKYFPDYVSIESACYRGRYLRYQNPVLVLNEEKADMDFYRRETSFKLTPSDLIYIGNTYTFSSYTYQDYRIGVKDDGVLVGIKYMSADEYVITKGLNGQNGTVSFQSAKDSNKYLRHQSFTLKLHQYESTSSFKNDASFFVRENQYFKDYVAFESTNYPNYFLRQQNFNLVLQSEMNLESYIMDASFQPLQCGTNKIGYSFSFESYNAIQYRIGVNKDLTLSLIYMGVDEFTIVKGLNGQVNSVSFQLVANESMYLCEQNSILRMVSFVNTAQIKNGASFFIREKKYFPGYASFESTRNSGFFIATQNDGSLSVQKEVSLSAFQKSASFRLVPHGARYIGLSYQLGSYNYPQYSISVKPDNTTAIVTGDQVMFTFTKSLNGRFCAASLSLSDSTNSYLRNQSFLIKLDKLENTVSFRNAGSFIVHQDRYYPGCVSFESTKYSGYFIRHEVCVLKLQEEDIEDELYRKNASFKLIVIDDSVTEDDGLNEIS
ncbi:uncharacterized protein LOC100202073 isoform X2 [Hydra vulgaris]|uniref:Uncharacterized protein LOC100202073 isoform X2 n=1 Tax=Hydra vulgaris TaxID=6087 RepID=A0ABM4BYD9_HYDVU